METSHWSGNSALTIRLWSGETSNIAPFDSFRGFRPHSIPAYYTRIAVGEIRLRPTTFRFFFSLSMYTWPGLAYQGIVSLFGHEDMAFSCFCGHMLRNSRELPRDQIR